MVHRAKRKLGRLGNRIQQGLDGAGMTLADLSKNTRIPYRTLQDWQLRDELPPGMLASDRWDAISRLIEPGKGRMFQVNESRGEERGSVQPPTELQRDALDQLEAIRGEIAELLDLVEREHRLSAVVDAIEKADLECALAERHLRRKLKEAKT